MSDFRARSVQMNGGFILERPAGEVFGLFSPLGEKLWVPGWSPELLHPPGASWEQGLLFHTRGGRGMVLWVVTGLDRGVHHVQYHRLEPGLHVARIAVRCASLVDARTQVRVSYDYVGITDDGNAEIATMTPQSFDRKMLQWKAWIDRHLTRGGRTEEI